MKPQKELPSAQPRATQEAAYDMSEADGARLIGSDLLSELASDSRLTSADLEAAHRAQLLVHWLTANALSLPTHSTELRAEIRARIERTWSGFFGSFKGDVMVLMALVDAIEAANREDAQTPKARARACRSYFSTWHPEHAARLELSSIESALLVWRNSATGGAQTSRWNSVHMLAREAGLTPPASASISRVWRNWRAAFRSD